MWKFHLWTDCISTWWAVSSKYSPYLPSFLPNICNHFESFGLPVLIEPLLAPDLRSQ